MNKRTTKAQSNKDLFREKIFYIEAFDESGLDVSLSHEKILTSHGATVSKSFGEHCSHLIWLNGKTKRKSVAEMMGVFVASPLWIEKCIESSHVISDNDFLNVSIISSKDICEQKEVGNRIKPIVSNSKSSISKRNNDDDILEPTTKAKRPKPTAAISYNKQTKDVVLSKASTESNDIVSQRINISKSTDQESNLIFNSSIPLPTFKLTTSHPIVMPVSSTGSIRRSSHRISERTEEDEEDEDSTSYPPIDPSVPIPVIWNDDPTDVFISKRNKKVGVVDEENLSPNTPQSPEGSSLNRTQCRTSSRSGKQTKAPTVLSAKKKIVSTETIKQQPSSAVQSAVAEPPVGRGSRGKGKGKGQTSMKTADSTALDPPQEEVLEAHQIVMTGFDVSNGEKETMEYTIRGLNALVSASWPLVQAVPPAPTRCVVVSAAGSTKRSLSILLALSAGCPIVTDEWVYASVCSAHWLAPELHLLPRYSRSRSGVQQQYYSPPRLLEGMCFYVASSAVPDKETLCRLVTEAGAEVCLDAPPNQAFNIIFGTLEDAKEAAGSGRLDAVVSKMLKGSSTGKIFTLKWLSDSLEQGSLVSPPQPDKHLVPPSLFKPVRTVPSIATMASPVGRSAAKALPSPRIHPKRTPVSLSLMDGLLGSPGGVSDQADSEVEPSPPTTRKRSKGDSGSSFSNKRRFGVSQAGSGDDEPAVRAVSGKGRLRRRSSVQDGGMSPSW